MGPSMSRREFLKETALIGAAAAAMRSADGAGGATQPAGKIPAIKLGQLEVSRFILGSNPFFGFAHGPGGGDMRAYYTPERIMAVMEESAGLGVTAVAAPPYGNWIELWKKYQDSGGKIKIWIAQPDRRPLSQAVEAAAKGGAKAIFIQGLCADAKFRAKLFDDLTELMKQIQGYGLPAGIASHRFDTHLEYQKRGIPNDFYYQCIYPHDRVLAEDFNTAMAAVEKLEKPVVGYKVLAAGRIEAKKAFTDAFARLKAKDGVCVGIFKKAKPDMIEEDVGLTVSLTRDPSARSKPTQTA